MTGVVKREVTNRKLDYRVSGQLQQLTCASKKLRCMRKEVGNVSKGVNKEQGHLPYFQILMCVQHWRKKKSQ